MLDEVLNIMTKLLVNTKASSVSFEKIYDETFYQLKRLYNIVTVALYVCISVCSCC